MERFRIYQIKIESELAFRDLQTAGSPNPVSYTMVYNGALQSASSQNEKTDYEILEDLYYIFNAAHPPDYKARSLSVSDIVELYNDTTSHFYFCDTIGFKAIDFDYNKLES